MPAGTRSVTGRAWPLLVVVLALLGCGREAGQSSSPPTFGPASGTATPGAPTATAGPPTAAQDVSFHHQPLWPFADSAQVSTWLDTYRAGGNQPWHLDADATALGFSRDYLGFGEIDRVTTRTTSGDEAWIGVGFALPDNRDSTAAVLHLARFGTGADAPWEVVGTRDDTLVVDTPAYGSVVTSPATVGGTITGVDESLRLQIHEIGAKDLAGESCCRPAGGERSRWSVAVNFTATTGSALTVVVSTGGHVADVERFAITAVRAA
jgi:hypothetical protein